METQRVTKTRTPGRARRFRVSVMWKALRRRIIEAATRDKIDKSHSHRMQLNHTRNAKCEFARLCDLYGTDKGELEREGQPYASQAHSYNDLYTLLFRQKREAISLVVECGLGSNNPKVPFNMGVNGKPGASLRVWRDYFPRARIVGVDIDPGILFSEERIDTYQCDQTSAASISDFAEKAGIGPRSVDIIVDDGFHKFEAGRSFFEGMIDYLADDGVYIVEDIQQPDRVRYQRHFAALGEQYVFTLADLHRPGCKLGDNSVAIIWRNL